jgi:hypothetical protein
LTVATTIANLAIQLSARADQLFNTLDRSVQRTAAWGGQMQAVANNVGNKFSATLQNGMAPVSKSIGLLGHAFSSFRDILASIPVVGGFFAAIPTSMQGFINLVKDEAKEMLAMSRQAQRLGVSLESLAAIQLLSGGAAESMERGMLHLMKMVGELNAGSQEAAKTFAKFNLGKADFVGAGSEEVLGKILDKFTSLASPIDRAYLAMTLFGKGGTALLPILAKGNEGLAAAKEQIKQYAGAFDDRAIAGLAQMQQSLKQIDFISTNLKRQFAVEFAPLIAIVAEEFARWVKALGPMDGVFKSIAEGAGVFISGLLSGIAEVVDAIKEMFADIKEMIATAKGIKNAVKGDENEGWFKKLWKFTTPVGWALSRKFGGKKDQEGGLGDMMSGAAQGAVGAAPPEKMDLASRLRAAAERAGDLPKFWEQLAKRKKAAGAEALPDQHMQELAEKAGELEEKLRAGISSFGAGSDALERFKLAQQGATPAMLANIDALIQEKKALEEITGWATGAGNIFDDYAIRLDALNNAFVDGTINADGFKAALIKLQESLQKSIGDKAASVFEQTRTPLEKFHNKIGELQGLLETGAIDWDTYQRAVAQASQELIALRKNAEQRNPAAIQAGTQEAFKTIIQNDKATTRDPAADLQDAIRQQIEWQKAQLKMAERIARAVEADAAAGVF